MAAKSPTGMIIDGVFASEAIDSSGEIVSIEGMDISTMEEGYGVANYEHLGEDGGFGKEVCGRIVSVRKILKESDCENDRQREYWNKIKGIPFLYGVVRLYDGAGHEGAKALAAQIRDHVANDEVVLVRFSIEGTTVEKDGNRIKSSLAKRVALTLKPCNRTCVSGVLEDPNAPDGFADVKKAEAGMVDPEFRKLGGAQVLQCNPCIAEEYSDPSYARIVAAAGVLRAMRKAMEAGNMDVAPSALTGGAALQRQDFVHKQKNQALAALRDFQGRKFTRAAFKEFAKAKLPEVSDEFLEHFTDIAENYNLKKAEDEKLLARARHLEAGMIDLRKNVREALGNGGLVMPEVRNVEMRVRGQLHPAGRFMIHNGKLSHLEDYHGLLATIAPAGHLDDRTIGGLHHLNYHPEFAVTTHEPSTMPQADPAPAAAADPVVQVTPDAPPPRPAVFHYHRPGMVRPHVVEFGPNGAALDGSRLSEAELQLMLENVEKQVATLRYGSGGQPLAKGQALYDHPFGDDYDDVNDHEGPFVPHSNPLASSPDEALQLIREAVKKGHLHPDVERTMTRHIYEDKMIPGVGNKYAWEQFHAKGKPGVYLSIDGNDIKSVNDTHGHAAGDGMIRSLGSALKSASMKVGNGKLFRSGGDEFVAHFPTYEDASHFIRHARNHMDSVPPVNGTHRLSVSFGLGNDYHTADLALYKAKEGKKDPVTGGRLFAPGHVPHLTHSLIPGTEGAVPHPGDAPPAAALPKKTTPPVASATPPTPAAAVAADK